MAAPSRWPSGSRSCWPAARRGRCRRDRRRRRDPGRGAEVTADRGHSRRRGRRPTPPPAPGAQNACPAAAAPLRRGGGSDSPTTIRITTEEEETWLTTPLPTSSDSGSYRCRHARLQERAGRADGDFDKAVELLRIKGAKDVGKRAERATAEGLVAAKDGALIELDSETDFVAKNAEFQLADRSSTSPLPHEGGRRRRADGRRSAARRSSSRSRPCRRRSARSSSCAARRIRRHRRDLPAQAGRRPAARGRCAGRVHRRRRGGRAQPAHADRRAKAAST